MLFYYEFCQSQTLLGHPFQNQIWKKYEAKSSSKERVSEKVTILLKNMSENVNFCDKIWLTLPTDA